MASSKARGEREPEAYPQGYVEDSFEPRTKIGERRVLARRGWAGEMMAVFTSLSKAEESHHGKTHQ
jgi:hypothetical protein